MDWLDKLSAKKGVIGIEVLPDGLAIAAKGCLGKGDAIDITAMIRDEENTDLMQELEHFIDKHKLAKRLCHIILNPKEYQLLLVESPDVPDEELREAVKWRIKDLISSSLEDVVVDVFPVPSDASKSAKKMVYAVVSPLGTVKHVIDLVSNADLTLATIDIGEMALRNISLIIEKEQNRSVGITRLTEGGGVVSLYKDGNLYLSRQFQIAYGGGLLDDLPVDTLALEVQRSLDYYERQMGLAPPSGLYVCGENITEDKITQELTRSINVPVRFLDLSEVLECPDELDSGMLQLCLGALGGVYREVSA